MADDELIKKFVDLHAQAENLLIQDKIADAKQKYLEVIEAYHAIDKSQLEKYHKELAYEHVTQLFKKVNQARERVKIPYHLIVAAILIIGFSFLVFLKPSIVGLIGLDDIVRQDVSFTFTQSKVQQVTLQERPLSLSASGEYAGHVKLFLKQGEKLELIFDSAKNEGDGMFTDVCVDTCDVIVKSNVVELFAQIDQGSALTLKQLTYKVQNSANTPPVWTGKTRIFTLPPNQPTVIDLNSYFTDEDKDDIVFLSTAADGMDVNVQNSKVTITPIALGSKTITFIASDLKEVTRVPVTIEIK